MNYYETFIQVAPDCPVQVAVIPRMKGKIKSAPVLEYELLSAQPYFSRRKKCCLQCMYSAQVLRPVI